MYEHLLNREVTLIVRLGDVSVPLSGLIIGETNEAIQFRIAENWTVEVYKAMVTTAIQKEGV